jgi:hypothetical protein
MSTKSCPACAEQIHIEAKKCKHCGEWLNTLDERSNTAADSRISENLIRLSKEHADGGEVSFKELLCLECSYQGQMPITRSIEPWYTQWYFFVPGCIIAGILYSFWVCLVIGILWGIFAVMETKHYVICPACETELGPT